MNDNQSLQTLRGAFSFWPPRERAGEIVRIYPFKRSLIGLLFGFGFLIAFSIPYFNIGEFMGGSEDSLFSLVTTMFTAFFLLGWSVGVLGILVFVLGLLVGQERVTIGRGRLTVRLEILGIGLAQTFEGHKIKQLSHVDPSKTDPTGWRGQHFVLRHESEDVEFGSKISADEAASIQQLVDNQVIGIEPDTTETTTVHDQPRRPKTASAPDDLTIESTSVIALIVANLVSILGVIFLGWSVGQIMLLYWAESAIIGFFNIAKMWKINAPATLLMGPLFLGHYGGFMIGHLLFIYALMLDGGNASLTTVLSDFTVLLPAFVALFISHTISFLTNFISREEWHGIEVSKQMVAPYKRIIVMHITLIFGGFLTMAFENPLPALLLMIVLKIVVDAKAHIKEHSRPA